MESVNGKQEKSRYCCSLKYTENDKSVYRTVQLANSKNYQKHLSRKESESEFADAIWSGLS